MDQPQPDFPLISQSAATLSEQLTRFRNIPAIDGGNAILARLDALAEEFRARDRNATARLRNHTVADRLQPLTPLVNPRTGEAIPGFPVTPAALSTLNGENLGIILAILGEQVPKDADTPEKQRLLRVSIGLVDIS